MSSELPHPLSTSMSAEQIDEHFVRITHTGNQNPMWHFGIALPREMNQLVSDRAEPPARDGEMVSLACFDREDHAANIEVYGAWIDREIDPADALDSLIAAQGLGVVSYRRPRTPGGVIGDAVVEWVYEGQPFAGRFFATKRGPRLFVLWARTPRENYAELADSILVSIGSLSIVEERPGPLAEVVSLVEGRRPVPWKAMVPKSWRVAAVAAGPKSASFPALLSSGDQLLARLLFVITAPTEATDPSDAATRHLGSLLPAGVGGDATDWAEEGPGGPFETSWLLVRTGVNDGGPVELRARVARHAGAWIVAGIIGPAREANVGLWMACKRLLDLVTFELEIHGSRSVAAPVVERPQITSRAEFRRQLEDAQPLADRLAGEHPDVWQFITLSQLLSSIEQMTNDRDPAPDERQGVAPMLDAIRQQSADASPELADLLSWFGAISDFFVNWPQTSAVDESAGDDADDATDTEIVPLPSFEDLIQTVRDGIEETETLRDVLQERMRERRHAPAANRASQALGDASTKLYDILRAVADWIRGEALMTESRRGELRIGRRTAKQLRDGPTAGLAHKIRQVDAFLETWIAPDSTSTGSVTAFENLVLALHHVVASTEQLSERFKEHPLPEKIRDRAERTIRRLAEWAVEGNIPSPEDREQLALWPVVEAHHALHTLPELLPLIERIRTLGLAVEDWPPPFRESFLSELYEADIDARLLVLRTGDESFNEVERRLQLAVYSAADGRIDTDYGRSQIALAEAYEKYLAMYLMAPQSGLIDAAKQIDDFLSHWQPTPLPDANLSPMEQALARPTVSGRVMQSADEYRDQDDAADEADEESAATALAAAFEPTDWYDDDGAATARSLGHGYWSHLLGSAIKSFSTDRSWIAHRRHIGMALRAIRRWTRDGRPAPEAYRRAVAWLFRSVAFDADHAPDGVSYPRDMIEVQSIHAYFQLWPDPDAALAKAGEDGVRGSGGLIQTAEEFAETVDETLADAECLAAATSPPLPQNTALVRAVRRIKQSVAYGRSLRPEDKAEIDRVLGSVEPPPEQFPFVPDFAEDFVSRVRRLNDYFQGRRVNSTAAFFELLDAAHADVGAAIRGRVWDSDKDPLAALERQLRSLKRWTADGRSPTAAERAGTREVLRTAAALKAADSLAEFVRRCGELADALDVVFPEAGKTPAAPPPRVDGREALGHAVEEAVLDAHSLSARTLFAKPTPLQQAWLDRKNKLGELVKLLDPSRSRTQRERDEITAALTGELPFDGNPFPAVPDFRENLAARLHAIARAFNDLMAAEPYASKESKALSSGGIDLVTLGRSVRLHFARVAGAGAGIYTCRFDRKHRDVKVGELDVGISDFVPTDREMLQLVASDGWSPTAMRVSPHNEYVAYSTSGPRGNEVAWCPADEAGERGRVPGAAFTWTTKGATLIVLDPPSGTVWRIDAGKKDKRELLRLPSPAATTPAPRLIVSPDGERVAVSYVAAGSSVSELLVIEYQGRSATTRLIGKETGGGPARPIELLPFWAKDGTQLAYLAIDAARRSSWICAYQPYQSAPPERLYSADRIDIAEPPSWSPTGRWISFLRRGSDGEPQLALLDCDRREVLTLEGVGPLSGRAEFGDESVLLHGGTIGISLWLRNLPHKREEPERF